MALHWDAFPPSVPPPARVIHRPSPIRPWATPPPRLPAAGFQESVSLPTDIAARNSGETRASSGETGHRTRTSGGTQERPGRDLNEEKSKGGSDFKTRWGNSPRRKTRQGQDDHSDTGSARQTNETSDP